MSIVTTDSPPSLRHLVGKRVVVIGGSTGIGYAVGRAALEQGANVVIASLTPDRLATAIAALETENAAFKGAVEGRVVDMREQAAIENFFDAIGNIDHLVITAGGELLTGFRTDTIEAQRDSFTVRFWAVVISAKHVLERGYINPGGSITLSTGLSHLKPRKGLACTGAGAAAMDGLTRGLAVEFAPSVRVNCISAGRVDTPMYAHLSIEARTALLQMGADQSLVKRVATSEEVAEAYLFAMKCANLCGETIEVEGGTLLA